MAHLFGLLDLEGPELDPAQVRVLAGAWVGPGAGRPGLYQGRGVVLARVPGPGPSGLGPAEREPVLLAAGRLDNRAELQAALGWPREDAPATAADLLEAAYRRWGVEAFGRIHGDWVLAAWHPQERCLRLARDPHGASALYYLRRGRTFAFATRSQALLGLVPGGRALDELYLAEVLGSWDRPTGDRTIHRDLRQVPPAHWLAASPAGLEGHRYWRLEDTPDLHLPTWADYREGFLDRYRAAVASRLEAAGPDPGAPGVTLSGGLDSGSVAALAAEWLASRGGRLQAFTAIPRFAAEPRNPGWFGNEWSFAQATAWHHPNIDLVPVPATGLTPVQGLRRMLAVRNEPLHAAGNLYWMLALFDLARAAGCPVLLTGQQGNGGVSWTGWPSSQSVAWRLRHLGWTGFLADPWQRGRNRLLGVLPAPLGTALRQATGRDAAWLRRTALNPAFARRLRLAERWWEDPSHRPPRTPREARCRLLQPGRSALGSLYRDLGDAFGMAILDPTADARLLAYVLAIPDARFRDPATGLDRWLIRDAMAGRLPDAVRLNRRRGLQAADLPQRLGEHPEEVDQVLAGFVASPAESYLDLGHLGAVWGRVRAGGAPDAQHLCVAVLLRGLMAGLFVNQWFGHGESA